MGRATANRTSFGREMVAGGDGTAAPRLAETRLRGGELVGVWDQLVEALVVLARHGLAHGDLSATVLLVDRSGALLLRFMKKLFAATLGILTAVGGFVDVGDLLTISPP